MRICVIVGLRSFLDPAFASKGLMAASVDLGARAKTRPQESIPLRKHREDSIGPEDDMVMSLNKGTPI